VMDYIVKSSINSMDYIIRLLRFILFNHEQAVMIVDDSRSSRFHIVRFLKRLHMTILEAGSGKEAIAMLEEHPEIKLLTADMYMPGMDGTRMVREIRKTHPHNTLAIIGVSGASDHKITTEFLKAGANDFMHKPIIEEELFTRIVSNIEMLDYIRLAKEASIRDYLTGLYNRSYLFESGEQFYANAKRENFPIIVAMMDIDHFKMINDRYGHSAGDIALKRVASIMTETIRSTDIVARYGGEEFVIVMADISLDDAEKMMNRLRESISQAQFTYKHINFSASISIGLNDELGTDFPEMIDRADKALYQAKKSGRNRVVLVS